MQEKTRKYATIRCEFYREQFNYNITTGNKIFTKYQGVSSMISVLYIN